MAKQVITVPGAFSTYNTANFGGAPFTSPNVRIAGPSGSESNWNNNTITDSAITTDMNNLYTLILNNYNLLAGLLVFGHSRGAQTINKLFRERKADLVANIDPARVLFVSSGNPERKHNGASVIHYSGHQPVYPGTPPYLNGYGLPDPTPFVVHDIARQYDEWADHPRTDDSSAQRTLTTNASVHSAYSGAADLTADGVPVNWDDWTWWEEFGGNVKYFVSPYFPHPSTPAQPAASSLAKLHPMARRRQNEMQGVADQVARASDEYMFARPKVVAPPRANRWTGVL